jgi:hypothetical protein
MPKGVYVRRKLKRRKKRPVGYVPPPPPHGEVRRGSLCAFEQSITPCYES